MTSFKTIVLFCSFLIIIVEAGLLIIHSSNITHWLSQHWWVVIIPFIKTALKQLANLKLVSFFKVLLLLIWHIGKLLLLKLLKSVGLRYGLFFSQYRWRWIRKSKILFLRRGKQLFRKTTQFWNGYLLWQKVIIFIAFLPLGLLIFLLGLSFNLTRKTIVQKTQEAAVVKMAETASEKSRGITNILNRFDRRIIKKIKQLNEPPK